MLNDCIALHEKVLSWAPKRTNSQLMTRYLVIPSHTSTQGYAKGFLTTTQDNIFNVLLIAPSSSVTICKHGQTASTIILEVKLMLASLSHHYQPSFKNIKASQNIFIPEYVRAYR